MINNNVATEITRLEKNMAALQNLAASENLALSCHSENSAPLILRSPLSFWNLAPKTIFFLVPPLVLGGWGEGCILCNMRKFIRCDSVYEGCVSFKYYKDLL